MIEPTRNRLYANRTCLSYLEWPGEGGPILMLPSLAFAWIPEGRQVDLPGVNHFSMLLQDEPPVVDPILDFLEETLKPTAKEEMG